MTSRPKVCPRPQPQRGYFLLVVLWNRASIYIGFWRWALGILQYPSRKRLLYFQRGPRLKNVTEGPGRLRYATACNARYIGLIFRLFFQGVLTKSQSQTNAAIW